MTEGVQSEYLESGERNEFLAWDKGLWREMGHGGYNCNVAGQPQVCTKEDL